MGDDPCMLAHHAEAAKTHAPRFATLLEHLSRAIDNGVQREVADLCESVGAKARTLGLTVTQSHTRGEHPLVTTPITLSLSPPPHSRPSRQRLHCT